MYSQSVSQLGSRIYGMYPVPSLSVGLLVGR